MGFMQMQIYRKGTLYACDCPKCGATNYSHEWISDVVRNAPEMWIGAECDDCGRVFSGIESRDVIDCGKQYAGRYSAPGYLDCTSWSFNTNKRTLAKELRDMYGEE